MTNEPELFTKLSICNACGAIVVNENHHKAFHEQIVDAFTDYAKAIQKVAKRA